MKVFQIKGDYQNLYATWQGGISKDTHGIEINGLFGAKQNFSHNQEVCYCGYLSYTHVKFFELYAHKS